MIVAVVMVFLAVPVMPRTGTVYADEEPAAPAEPVNVYVTVTNAGEVAVANELIEVADADFDGTITLDDVFVAVHEKEFEGGAAAGYAKEFNDDYQSYSITKFWGVSNGGSYVYYVNNAMAWGLSAPVVEGDHVVAGVMKDAAGYSDKYAYFDAFDYDAQSTLTVKLMSATGEYDEYWNPVFGPCTDAELTLSLVSSRSAFDYSVVNNGDGTYDITFFKAGDYKLFAKNDATPLVPAVANVKVTGTSDKDYKFMLRISSDTETNGTGSVLGTVYDDYSADLQFGGTHVNRSNFTLEMWMKNVASLDVDAGRYYTRTVNTGATGDDTSMATVKSLFNGFDAASTIKATVDGETTVTYTVQNEDGAVKASPDSFNNAHDTWYAIVNEENMKVTHSEEEGDSYIVIAKGSWLQIGDQRLDVESELKLDDFGDLATMQGTIKDAVTLNPADEAVDTIEFYLERGTTLAVSSSSVELLRDAKFTVDIDGYEESELSEDLQDLRDAADAEAVIKAGYNLVKTILGEMGGGETAVTIDFGHIYPAADEQDEENPNPVWTWTEGEDGKYVATATFTCLNNDEHTETFTTETDPAVVMDYSDLSKVVATVVVNGETYTDEMILDIVVLPYPGTEPFAGTVKFTENTDDKDITNDETDTYTIVGHQVTVKCADPCKLGYLSEDGSKYIAVTDLEKIADDQYTFTVPDEIMEVILVVKGDTNLNGQVDLGDAARVTAFFRHKGDISIIEAFAGHVVEDEAVVLGDAARITAVFRHKYTLTWGQ